MRSQGNSMVWVQGDRPLFLDHIRDLFLSLRHADTDICRKKGAGVLNKCRNLDMVITGKKSEETVRGKAIPSESYRNF